MADTRARLLQGGLEALREIDPQTIIAAIGTRELARRAGVSSATFFHHFDNLESYTQALLHHMYPADRTDEMTLIGGALEMYAQTATPVEVGHLMFHGALAQRIADPNLRIRIGMWAFGGVEIDALYAEFLKVANDALRESMERIFKMWGRELRPPLDAEFAIALFTSFNLGGAINHILLPEVIDGDRYAQATMALMMGILRLQGDRRTIEDRLAEMNYYPTSNTRLGLLGTRSHGTRVRIIDAAAALFGDHGFDATSVAMIAKSAGVSAATVYEHFRSKAGIGIALFDAQAEFTFERASNASHASPEAALRAHLGATAEFVGARTDHARPYVTALICHDEILADDSFLRARTRDLVAAAQAAGVVRADESVAELADLALSTVISRVIGKPSDDANAVTAWAFAALA